MAAAFPSRKFAAMVPGPRPMRRRLQPATPRLAAAALALLSAPGALYAGAAPPAEPPAAEPERGPVTDVPDLPEGHLAVIAEREKISLPSPVEYFTAIAKATNPRWRKWYLELVPDPPAGRPKVGASLGMLLAEAHLATMARDGQRLRNVGAEISSRAKVLGLEDAVAPRLAAVETLAGEGNWGGVHVEFEALGWEIGSGLLRQRDGDLALLVLIGQWLRVLHIGSAVVGLGEVGDLSLAAGGEGLPGLVAGWAGGLSEECRAQEDIAFMLRHSAKLTRTWSPEKFAGGREFTLDEVKDTHSRIDAIISRLSK